MPKPENNERQLREWLRDQGRDDLVAWTRCITASPSMQSPGSYVTISASSASPGQVAAQLGRDLADNAVVLGDTRALVLTASRFLVVRLSGFKERPKQLEIDVDASGIVVHHLDAEQAQGHTARYFVVDLPDGRWMVDSMIVVMKGGKRGPFADAADHFLAALGERARPIPVG